VINVARWNILKNKNKKQGNKDGKMNPGLLMPYFFYSAISK
jgi:hypothetical protein